MDVQTDKRSIAAIVLILLLVLFVLLAIRDKGDSGCDGTAFSAPSCGPTTPTSGPDEPTATTTSEPDNEPTTAASDPEGPSTGAPGPLVCPDDSIPGHGLVIGTAFPVNGTLGNSAPTRIAAVRQAIADINRSGGVFGTDVVLADQESEYELMPEVRRLISEVDVHAIIGPSSSDDALSVIDTIVGCGVIQFSSTNTAPSLTSYPDDGLYFRTAPSDRLQARSLANQIFRDRSQRVALIYRDDPYGSGFAEVFEQIFKGAESRVVRSAAYPKSQQNFEELVKSLVEAEPDAIVAIGFEETADLVEELARQGVGPQTQVEIWTVDGSSDIEQLVEPKTILSGLRQTYPSSPPSLRYSNLLDSLTAAIGGNRDDLESVYAAETYDAAIILALAAEGAASGRGDATITRRAIAEQIVEVTRDGTVCETFDACAPLIASGQNIDYNGIGGEYEFVDRGEPSIAHIGVDEFNSAGRRRQVAFARGSVCIDAVLNDLPEILFDPGSAVIPKESLADLDAVAAKIRLAQFDQLEIRGFSDSVGSPASNLVLSQARADEVLRYLQQEGALGDSFPLDAVGLGESTKSTEASLNRAVRFKATGVCGVLG